MVAGRFVESVRQYERNRLEARRVNAVRAVLADGEDGVMFSIDGRIHVFSDAEVEAFLGRVENALSGDCLGV